MSVYYTEDHEWINLDGDVAIVGITVHAQDALGDVVFVDLPAVGSQFAQKAIAGVGRAQAGSFCHPFHQWNSLVFCLFDFHPFGG